MFSSFNLKWVVLVDEQPPVPQIFMGLFRKKESFRKSMHTRSRNKNTLTGYISVGTPRIATKQSEKNVVLISERERAAYSTIVDAMGAS